MRLRHQRRTVSIGKKGLALLARLALGGPARREEIADLLWDGPTANDNLRVLLSRLRRRFRELGYLAFEAGEETLAIPEYIDLEPVTGEAELLPGFEALSSGMAAWLAEARAAGEPRGAHEDWAASVAETLVAGRTPPRVVVLEVEPGVPSDGIARATAERLGLPLLPDGAAARPGLHHVHADAVSAPSVSDVVRQAGHVWLLERSAYGEDAEWLMALRSGLPAEAMRYRSPPLLPWTLARRGILSALPFEEAARLYVHSGGHPGYLEDLVAMRGSAPFPRRLPVPHRTASAYLLEALRTLDGRTREALERLAVHPSPLQLPVIRALDAEPFLHALERARWLRYRGGWRFTSEAARASLYGNLPAGQRARWHVRAAEASGRLGDLWSRAFHLQAAHPSRAPDAVDASIVPTVELDPAAGGVLRDVGVDGELALAPPALHDVRGLSGPETVSFVRDATRMAWSGADWQLPDRPSLVRVLADVWAPHYVSVDYVPGPLLQVLLRGASAPVQVVVRSGGRHRAATVHAQQVVGEGIGVSLVAPPGASLQVRTTLPRGLVAVTVRAHRLVEAGAARRVPAVTVPTLLAHR